MCLAGRKPAKHIRDGDPHVADARTATPLAGLDCDDVLVFHGANLASFSRKRSSVVQTNRNYRSFHTSHAVGISRR
jgi:hypothetical protein